MFVLFFLDFFIAGKVNASSWPPTELCFLPLKILTTKGVYYKRCFYLSIDKFDQLFKEENNIRVCALQNHKQKDKFSYVKTLSLPSFDSKGEGMDEST